MPESQSDIDALLAEVNALADEADDDAGGGSPADISPASVSSPSGSASASTAVAATAPRRGDLNRILNLEVPVIVPLAETTMTMSDIVNLGTGAIIEFERPADSHLDLMINNKCIGLGQPVKVGENFGLRVMTIGSVQDRVRALGSE